MSVIVGENAGFILFPQTNDPTGGSVSLDGRNRASKFTTPSNCTKITDLGWYCSFPTEEADYVIAIYEHDSGDDEPGNRLYTTSATAKGTDIGWKKVSGLDVSVSADTIYWLVVGLENTVTGTSIDKNDTGTGGEQTTTPVPANPYGDFDITDIYNIAVYAVYDSIYVESIGSYPGDRIGTTTHNYTYVLSENPATQSGTIQKVEFYMNSVSDDKILKIGTFRNTTGTTFKSINTHSFDTSTLSTGLNTIENLNWAVQTGDYIGIYLNSIDCTTDRENSGDGYYILSGDQMDGNEHDFSLISDRTMSLRGFLEEDSTSIDSSIINLNLIH